MPRIERGKPNKYEPKPRPIGRQGISYFGGHQQSIESLQDQDYGDNLLDGLPYASLYLLEIWIEEEVSCNNKEELYH